MLRLRPIALGCLLPGLLALSVATLHAQAPAASDAPGAPDAPAAADSSAPGALSSPPPPAAPLACPSHNLVRGARAELVGATTGARFRASDGVLAVEGTEWNATPALQLTEPSSRLILDLHQVHPIGALLLQGDNNDLYVIEGSEDGVRYRPLWTAPATDVGFGLRSRFVKLKTKVPARYLRVRGQGGDGFFSISELQAFCEPDAKAWPPKLRLAPVKHGWEAITNEVMVAIKGITAALGMVVLLLLWWRERGSRPRWSGAVLNSTLALVGLLSFANWWNLGHYHFDHYIHVWEHYHYYIGAKYPELRYSRIYECTAVADMEDGLRDPSSAAKSSPQSVVSIRNPILPS